ncbi:hypothetical protein [Burkholderia sp. L27(2015)]|uniref:hypothetical protein n=1 Tax=Burkholderia sp. L27(2015) TaxID=1641858 RepID=UPI00131B49C0|nr:hypothetical protein [Burkholderia sp. L27(2015)]
MIKIYPKNLFKKLGLSFAILTVLSASALAADERNEKARPTANAARPENHADFRAAPRANEARGEALRHDNVRARYAYREHDVHRFNHDDLERWRGGRWNNTCYNGRCGWWWFSAGQWYFYDQPVYPYPLAVSPIEFIEPDAATEVPAPIVQAPLRVAAPPTLWYYCDEPRGYYPTVATCTTQFRQVAAPPPG